MIHLTLSVVCRADGSLGLVVGDLICKGIPVAIVIGITRRLLRVPNLRAASSTCSACMASRSAR
jgi:hypothetical protein